MVRPVTVNGLALPVAVRPPGLEVTVYPVMAAPPLETGAVKEIAASAFPATAETDVGLPGTVDGVTVGSTDGCMEGWVLGCNTGCADGCTVG